jgi:CBS domain-containing protein
MERYGRDFGRMRQGGMGNRMGRSGGAGYDMDMQRGQGGRFGQEMQGGWGDRNRMQGQRGRLGGSRGDLGESGFGGGMGGGMGGYQGLQGGGMGGYQGGGTGGYQGGYGGYESGHEGGYDMGFGGGQGMGRSRPQQDDEMSRVRAREIMTEDPETVTPDVTLTEAARKMRDLDVGIIPVVESDTNRRLRGVITDRDIAVRAVAEGRDVNSTKVSDCMTDDVETCNKNDSVRDVLELMQREQVRRVPITDREGRLVGIIAQADVAVDFADGSERRERKVARTVERISEPAHPERGGGQTSGRGGRETSGLAARGGNRSQGQEQEDTNR